MKSDRNPSRCDMMALQLRKLQKPWQNITIEKNINGGRSMATKYSLTVNKLWKYLCIPDLAGSAGQFHEPCMVQQGGALRNIRRVRMDDRLQFLMDGSGRDEAGRYI